MQVDARDSSALDITDLNSVRSVLATSRPDYLINAAAYTAVDKAESESEKAFLVNQTGALNLAMVCAEMDLPLIHLSSDYVFAGTASLPYRELDAVAPSGVYGASKLAGEQAIIHSCKKYVIVRTAWVYSEYGNNFVKTMLRLAVSGKALSVVDDQLGSPTYAGDVAAALLHICKSGKDAWGVYHYAGASQMSWYRFAENIFAQALARGLLNQPVSLDPIATSEYPTAAARPAYSVLDSAKIRAVFGVQTRLVDESLAEVLGRLAALSGGMVQNPLNRTWRSGI